MAKDRQWHIDQIHSMLTQMDEVDELHGMPWRPFIVQLCKAVIFLLREGK